ncbi:hypothetical protein Tco_0615964 [Tanacetum coccineum]
MDKFLNFLIDDILIYSKTKPGARREHLKIILEFVEERGSFVFKNLPTKIESVKDWASPKTPTEIRQFLGLAGFYRIQRCIDQGFWALEVLSKVKRIFLMHHDQLKIEKTILSRSELGASVRSEDLEALSERTGTTNKSRALVMTISLDLPKQILNAQTEARKPENIKIEMLEVSD